MGVRPLEDGTGLHPPVGHLRALANRPVRRNAASFAGPASPVRRGRAEDRTLSAPGQLRLSVTSSNGGRASQTCDRRQSRTHPQSIVRLACSQRFGTFDWLAGRVWPSPSCSGSGCLAAHVSPGAVDHPSQG
jgi:hypothetical protein